jgi:hypothetical protein
VGGGDLEALEFSVRDFVILLLSHTGRPKYHHLSLLFPKGMLLLQDEVHTKCWLEDLKGGGHLED